MSNGNEKYGDVNLDTKVLSNFIIEFNISLKLVTSYPKNHPIITSSVQKVLHLLTELLEFRTQVSLAVARDSLMVEYALLDSKNPVYRNLANVLFNHDIASLTFHKAVTAEEIIRFNEILALKLDHLREMGGVRQVAKESDIRQILIEEIDYSNFATTEEDTIEPATGKRGPQGTTSLWEDFAHGILEGSLDPTGSRTTYANLPEPGLLAEMVNECDSRADLKEESYAEVIASFLGELGKGDGTATCDTDSLDKLSNFVSKLNPAIRRQFLNGVFTYPGMSQGITKEVLEKFPNEIILEALQDINSRATYTPPVTISLLQRLSKTPPAAKGKRTVSYGALNDNHDNLTEKMRVIFQEDKSDEFIPSAYQEALRAITSMNSISMPELEAVEELRKTLLGHTVETQLCRVILEAMRMPSDKCKPEALEHNLLELLHYFLETGDFSGLAGLYKHVQSVDQIQFPAIIEFFTGQHFLETVLDCLAIWEKAKQHEIRDLIRKIGTPFVEPLLDRLAEEQNMSLRRSYMDCLVGLGEMVQEAAIARLADSRWYFVRNLIVILRSLNDSSVLTHFRTLREHRHPRVRQEVIKTFQHFRHPEADRLLLQDLQTSDRELQLNAILLAEKSDNLEVFNKLLSYFHIHRVGVTGFDFETRSAVVRTLAQIKNENALPALMSYLRTKHLFRQNIQNRLKVDIIKSFQNYKSEAVVPLLEELALSDQKELVMQVKEVLSSIQGGK